MPVVISSEQWHAELNTRRAAIWVITQHHECDALLVYGGSGHAEPFRYLTNFVPVLGDAWALMTAPTRLACVLNFNWQLIEARAISGVEEWYGIFNPVPTIIELLASSPAKKVAVVGLHRLPVVAYDAIRASHPAIEFVDVGAEVALLRRRKTPLEITLLKEACRITDVAFDDIRGQIRPGMTEQEAAARLAYVMQRLGARLSFEPTVISGNDAPVPIRMPTARKFEPGDSIMVDIGAEFQGYQADATRTFVLGKPNATQDKVWNTLLEAYYAALGRIRPGLPCIETHTVAAAIIEGAGFKMAHRVGHGIGLATSFEWPSLDSEVGPQIAGMTICIEPGIYVMDAGTMKLEDDVLVTETGYELLTISSMELVIPL